MEDPVLIAPEEELVGPNVEKVPTNDSGSTGEATEDDSLEEAQSIEVKEEEEPQEVSGLTEEEPEEIADFDESGSIEQLVEDEEYDEPLEDQPVEDIDEFENEPVEDLEEPIADEPVVDEIFEENQPVEEQLEKEPVEEAEEQPYINHDEELSFDDEPKPTARKQEPPRRCTTIASPNKAQSRLYAIRKQRAPSPVKAPPPKPVKQSSIASLGTRARRAAPNPTQIRLYEDGVRRQREKRMSKN